MKIGFSLGRCINDIVNERVDLDEVVLISAATEIVNKFKLQECVTQYIHQGYIKTDNTDRAYHVAEQLWDSGRIHQPRVNKHSPLTMSMDCHWMDVVPTVVDGSELVQATWRNYRMALKLANDRIPDEEDYRFTQHRRP